MKAPDWLDDGGCKTWDDNIGLLPRDVLQSPAMMEDFAQFCNLSSGIARMTKEVQGNEIVRIGIQQRKNPLLNVIAEYKREHRALSDRFGLNPYAKARLDKKQGDTAPDEELNLD